MRPPAVTLVLLAVAASALASCGEDETGAYRSEFAPLSRDIVKTGRGVETAIVTADKMKNDAEVAVTFAQLASDAAFLAGTLVKLEPPADLSKDHNALIRGLRRESGHLERITRAVIDGDDRAAKAATDAAGDGATAIRDPRRRIVDKLGID